MSSVFNYFKKYMFTFQNWKVKLMSRPGGEDEEPSARRGLWSLERWLPCCHLVAVDQIYLLRGKWYLGKILKLLLKLVTSLLVSVAL